MPTPIAFTIDDLDAGLKALKPSLNNRSDFAAIRTLAFKRALAEYQASKIAGDALLVRRNTFGAAITTGSTPDLDTSNGDIYKVDLPSGAKRVAGNSIILSDTGVGPFNVPRSTWDAIVTSGTDETLYAFWEDKGQIILWVKDATVTGACTINCEYYAELDATVTTGTDLDIDQEDFEQILSSTLDFMSQMQQA